MALESYSPGVTYTEDEVIPEVVGPDQLAVGIVGGARKGPEDLTLITSVPQLEFYFGKMSHDDFGIWAAYRCVKNGGKVYYKRVIGSGARSGEAIVDKFRFKTKGYDSTQNGNIVKLTKDADGVVSYIYIQGKKSIESFSGMDDTPGSPSYWVDNVNRKSNYLSVEYYPSTPITTTPTTEAPFSITSDCSQIIVDTSGKTKQNPFTVSFSADGTHAATITASESQKLVFDLDLGQVVGAATIEFSSAADKTAFYQGLAKTGTPKFVTTVLDATRDTITVFKNSSDTLAISETDSTNHTASYTVTLGNGNDGISTITDVQIVDAIHIFDNSDTLDVSSVIAPGRSDTTVMAALKSLTASRGDIQTIPDPPLGLSRQEAIDWANASGDYTNHTKVDSMFQGAYWPWVKDEDPNTGEIFLAPPSGWVLSQFIYNDKTSGAWFAAAGVQEGRGRGVLVGAKGLEYEMSKEERDEIYSEAQINPIVRFYQKGIAIWGNRTAYRESSGSHNSAFAYMNIRRLANYIRKIVISESLKHVFNPNDSQTWREWRLSVTPRLDKIKNNRGLDNYKVVMDATTVTEEMVSQGKMPGIIYVKPIKAVEYIPISFVITEDSVTFEEQEGEE